MAAFLQSPLCIYELKVVLMPKKEFFKERPTMKEKINLTLNDLIIIYGR
jgi:hypothetical protein